MTPLKPVARPVTIAKTTVATPPAKSEAPPKTDRFEGNKKSQAATLTAKIAEQTENLRLFREVFPDGTKPKPGVQVMFVSFKGDDRFITKKLNAAAGNTLVKGDWAPRLSKLLHDLDGTVHGGYRVKVLEHFYGMASLALVPEDGVKGSSDDAAKSLAAELMSRSSAELSSFLTSARADWASRGTSEAVHQLELLDGMLAGLQTTPPQLVSHGLTEVRFDARKGSPVFALMSAVYRARAAAVLEQLARDGGSERFDVDALMKALKAPDGLTGALERLKSATVSFGPLDLPVVNSDAVAGTQGLNPEVLRLMREKAHLGAAPGVLEDIDTVVQQATLLDFVAFESNRELSKDGTAHLEQAAHVQLALQEHPHSRSAIATAKALLAPQKAGVLVAQYDTPSEQTYFQQLAQHQHTVFLSVDIRALGATAQAAMIRQAAQLAMVPGQVSADDVFYRALAANDEVMQRKESVLGPIERALRGAANGQSLNILAFGDEAVFALSDWSPESLAQALGAVGSSDGARLVVTETKAVPGESPKQAAERNASAMGESDRGNELLKSFERQREQLRYAMLALPEPNRSVALAKLEQAVVSHLVASVTEAGVGLVDARTGATVSHEQLEAELHALSNA